MKVFLSHSSLDKAIVASIAGSLRDNDVGVWYDTWELTAGDSLVAKIGEGIEKADRLVVFLSANSVESNWVQREVETGIVMELAKSRGLSDKFVIPSVIGICKIPTLMQSKVYSNFTDKPYDKAIAELVQGIIGNPTTSFSKKFDTRIVRSTSNQRGPNFSLLVEVATAMTPINGIKFKVSVDNAFEQVAGYFAAPNNHQIPTVLTANYGSGFLQETKPTSHYVQFSEPMITLYKSYYLLFTGKLPMQVNGPVTFTDFSGKEP